MFVQNNEPPSCDPVDVQLMSETTERPMYDLRKSQITTAFWDLWLCYLLLVTLQYHSK